MISEGGSFESSIRRQGDLAGVFECDEETAYFYLCSVTEGKPGRILAATRVASGRPLVAITNAEVRWDRGQSTVGLLIDGILCAAFDSSGRTHDLTSDAPEALAVRRKLGFLD